MDQTPNPDAKKAHDEKKSMIQNKREENKRKSDENLEQIRKSIKRHEEMEEDLKR